MVWDTIHCQNEGYHWFFNANNFCTFFKNLPIERLLAWLQWWLVASSKPGSHICDIFYLFCMHSVKFLKGPSLTFLMNNFTMISAKHHEIIRQNFQSIVVGCFYWTHWQLASGFTNTTSYLLLNRLGIATNTVFSKSRTANYWKMR